MIMKNEFNQPTEEEVKILALEAKIKELQNARKKSTKLPKDNSKGDSKQCNWQV
jgi:hypothetical protein